jgi:hypothetical protein
MRPLKHTGSQFMGGGRLAAPVPTLGAEVLTNGDMETWASATDAGTWLETLVAATTINRDTDVHGGTYALRIDVDGSSSQSYLRQNSVATAGGWYQLTAWIKASASGKIAFLGTANFPWSSTQSVTVTTSYAQYVICSRAVTTNLLFSAGSGGNANISMWFDDLSLKRITLASMFSTRPYSTHATTKAMATIVAGTRAGVVANLDSATSPANFVIASHDGVTARLTKCVAGTYTELLAVTTTYAAGAYVEIRRIAGTNLFELYYNGAKVGATQTIADAGIVDNTLCGLFNTYSGNSLAAFSCIPNVALDAPVPALGAELTVNGDFEAGSPPSSWTLANGSTLASAADPRTGSAGTKSILVTRGTNDYAGFQSKSQTVGTWLYISGWAKVGTATSTNVTYNGGLPTSAPVVNTSTWTAINTVGWVTVAGAAVRLYTVGAEGTTSYFDDLSAKAITLASMFNARAYAATHCVVKAPCTIVAGTRAGVVANLDDPANPTSFVIASHDGTNARLTSYSGGTYTDLLAVTTTYSAGALVEIRRAAGTDSYELFYADTKVGATQTISGINGLYYGIFNTYSGNTIPGFICTAS